MTQRICTAEGCSSALLARGMCNAHYRRWQRAVNKGTIQKPTPPSTAERLLAKRRIDENGCWLWIGHSVSGAHPNHVYGIIYIHGHRSGQLTHRVAYELWVGPIPEGREIDHVRA